jgi:hypothetical protein
VGWTSREDEAIRFRLLVPTLACRKVIIAGNFSSWPDRGRTAQEFRPGQLGSDMI